MGWSCGQTSLSGRELNCLYLRDSKPSVFLSALYILSHSKTVHVADVNFGVKTRFGLTWHAGWKCSCCILLCLILADNIRFIVSSTSAVCQEGPTEFFVNLWLRNYILTAEFSTDLQLILILNAHLQKYVLSILVKMCQNHGGNTN